MQSPIELNLAIDTKPPMGFYSQAALAIRAVSAVVAALVARHLA